MQWTISVLLYCGWNGFGQVPNYSESALTTLTQVDTEEPPTSVSCSWSALCIVSGTNLYVRGFLDRKANTSMKFSIQNGETIQQIVNNSKHLVALTKSRKLWRRSATSEQRNSQFTFLPFGELATDNDSNELAKKVSCSDNICLALTDCGSLYAIPSRVNDPSLIVADMACGNEHAVFITASGSVYTYGQGSRGQLGHGDLEAEEEPRELHALAGLRMKQVSCGGWHCAVLSDEGDLYTWGWNRFGQLGVTEERDQPVSRSISNIGGALDPGSTSAKKETKFHDCDIDDGSGGVYSLPQLVGWTEKRVTSVSCGLRHTVVLLEDGTLWGCGWNGYGQLGVSSDSNPQLTSMTEIPITTPGKIHSVVCGGWSTCVLIS